MIRINILAELVKGSASLSIILTNEIFFARITLKRAVYKCDLFKFIFSSFYFALMFSGSTRRLKKNQNQLTLLSLFGGRNL